MRHAWLQKLQRFRLKMLFYICYSMPLVLQIPMEPRDYAGLRGSFPRNIPNLKLANVISNSISESSSEI